MSLLTSRIYPITISLTANQVKLAQQITTETKWFAFKKITAWSTGNFEIRPVVNGRPIAKFFAPKVNATGISTFPFIQTAWAWLPGNSYIQLDIKDLSGSSNVVRISFIGVEGPEKEVMAKIGNRRIWPFWYPGEITLAGNAQDELLLNTDQDGDFRLIKLLSSSTSTSFEANIKAGPKTLSRKRAHHDELFGTAQLPLIVDPWDVTGGLPIEIDAKDLSGSSNTVKFNLVGHKILRSPI